LRQFDSDNKIATKSPSTSVTKHLVCHTAALMYFEIILSRPLSFLHILNRLTPVTQGARMSKITNDGLTRSCTGCFIN